MKESTKQDFIWLGIFAAVVLAIVLYVTIDSTIWYNVKTTDVPGKSVLKYCELIDSQDELCSLYGDTYSDEYDERFFKRKSIIVFGGGDRGARGKTRSIGDVRVEGETLIIEVMCIENGGQNTQGFTPYCNLVTVRKSAIKNVKEVRIEYVDMTVETIFGRMGEERTENKGGQSLPEIIDVDERYPR